MTPSRRLIAVLAAVCAVSGVVLIVLGVIPDPREALPVAGKREVEKTLSPTPAATRGAAERPRARPVSAAVRAQAARLPIEQQVAQLFLVGFNGTELTAGFFEDLQVRGWGGVLYTADNFVEPAKFTSLTGEAPVVAKAAGRVEPLVVVTGEPADNGYLEGLPSQAELGGEAPAAVRARYRAAASGLGNTVDMVLGPSADVGYPSGPSANVAFGDDPGVVADLAAAAAAGWKAGGVLPAPKHFPGQGAASQDPLDGPTAVGLQREALEGRDLVPWRAVAPDVPAVVVSNAAYAAFDGVTPAALEPAITRDLLRDEVGFTGVAISADLAGAAASTGGSVGAAAVEALRAGIDLLAVHDPAEVEGAYAAVLAAVRDGKVPRARVTEALHRVLVLKASLPGEPG